MSRGNGNGIVSLNDHRAPKPTKAEQEQANLSAVEARVRAIAIEVAEHYAAQMPGLVAHMVGEMLHANGITLKAPPSWSETPAVTPFAGTETAQTEGVPAADEAHSDQSGAAAVPVPP